MSEGELRALMAAIADQRDRAAFARLFRYFGPKLKAYGMRGGADAETAEEVVQEAMLAVWRKAASFDPAKASVSTWLFTIVRNKRIDMLRREARPDLKEEDFLHLNGEVTDQEDGVTAEQQGAALRAGIAQLPEEQAEVIRKAYFEDKSHRAIAEELGLPLGTVKSRIRLALSRMRPGIEDTL
ncbi:MAG: sigma-70 family RNA polymerase sigma factor [Rhodothalassiaceae bacterium]